MNFKKTLVALATAGFVSGAMASDVELDNGIWTLSSEGIAIGATETLEGTVGTNAPVFDFFLSSEIPASGKVAITFGEGFDTDTFTSYTDASITNAGTTATIPELGGTQINYGSASFTFVKSSYDADTKTLTLTLGNGQPLLGGASFGLEFATASTLNLEMTDVATVSVKSMTKDEVEIESFSKVVSEIKPQFAVGLVEDMDGEIKALNRAQFVTGADHTLSDTTNGYGKVHVVNNTTYKAAADITAVNFTLMGEFDGLQPDVAPGFWSSALTVSNGTVQAAGVAVSATGEDKGNYVANVSGNTASLASAADAVTGYGKIYNFGVDSAAGAGKDSLVTPFYVSADIKVSGAAKSAEYLAKSNFGAWDLEGGVINVPYLPVNYPHLSANVEISNEDTKDAVIYVEAFDQDGKYYPRVQLPQVAAGQTVTKVSDADLINAFGLAGNRKLSVTFTFDAEGDADLITLAPYYRQNESRINVLSDEYKGK